MWRRPRGSTGDFYVGVAFVGLPFGAGFDWIGGCEGGDDGGEEEEDGGGLEKHFFLEQGCRNLQID